MGETQTIDPGSDPQVKSPTGMTCAAASYNYMRLGMYNHGTDTRGRVYYNNGAGTHGFLRNTDGSIVSLDAPGSVGTTVANGINDLGQIVGGVGVSLLVRRGWTFLGARRLLVVGGFLGAMSLLWMINAGDAASAVWRLNLSRFAFQAAYTALLVYGIESAPEGQAALMSGLMNAAFSACNFLFNPLIGAMVDRYHGYGPVLIMVGLSPLGGMAAWVVLTALHARGADKW